MKSLMIAVLLILPLPVPAEGCFCLRDPGENWWYDCVTFQPSIAPRPQTRCYDDQAGRRVEVDTEGFEVVPAGEEGCLPCEGPRARDGDGIIRGEGDDEPAEE